MHPSKDVAQWSYGIHAFKRTFFAGRGPWVDEGNLLYGGGQSWRQRPGYSVHGEGIIYNTDGFGEEARSDLGLVKDG